MAVIRPAAGQSSSAGPGRPHHGRGPAPSAQLQSAGADGEAQVAALHARRIPVEYPRLIPTGTAYEPPTAGAYPRFYKIRDTDGRPHAAYRLVLAFNSTLGQFYGVQGMTWLNPPILASPNEIRYVNGKRLELHFDGSHLRLVAWRTKQAVYWVSNTLSLDLTNQQMLGMAASATGR